MGQRMFFTKEQKPRVSIDPTMGRMGLSERVLVCLDNQVHFARFNNKLSDWAIEGVKDNRGFTDKNLEWCYIPKFISKRNPQI